MLAGRTFFRQLFVKIPNEKQSIGKGIGAYISISASAGKSLENKDCDSLLTRINERECKLHGSDDRFAA